MDDAMVTPIQRNKSSKGSCTITCTHGHRGMPEASFPLRDSSVLITSMDEIFGEWHEECPIPKARIVGASWWHM